MDEWMCYFKLYGDLICCVPHYNRSELDALRLVVNMKEGRNFLWRILEGDVHGNCQEKS